jgi:hypothetical protein
MKFGDRQARGRNVRATYKFMWGFPFLPENIGAGSIP